MNYTVHMSHAANPDLPTGYRTLKRPANAKATAKTFAEASRLCSEYIDRGGIYSGNWTGGQVFSGSEQVAQVSYNGRVWAMDGSEIK